MKTSRRIGSRRRITVLAMAAGAVISFSSARGFGFTDNEPTGATGSPGANATLAGGAGGTGGTGGNVSPYAVSTDSSNTATGTGGVGGVGGTGSSTATTGPGGVGGVGGTAISNAGTSVIEAQTIVTTVSAVGGAGGMGGTGGAGRGGFLRSVGGAGGMGGSATVSSLDVNSTSSPITVHATVTGGAGGAGGNGGATANGGAGGAGQGTTEGTIEGDSEGGGTVDVELVGSGGAGGEGTNGGTGGHGADEFLDNNAHGSTTGALTLSQTAVGGNGGGSNGGNAGSAGGGDSIFDLNAGGMSTLNATNIAIGGFGGNSEGGVAGAAGSVSASMNIQTNSSMTLVDTANKNNWTLAIGGNVDGGTSGTGGAGGYAETDAAGNSTGGVGHSAVKITTSTYAGWGGSVGAGITGSGGAGGGVQESVTGTNSTSDSVMISAQGWAGNGGTGQGAGFSGGAGGVATALSFSGSSSSGAVEEYEDAFSGNGGAGANGADGGNGADIYLSNVFTASTSGALSIYQFGKAGSSGGSVGGNPGIAGNATSILNMTFGAGGPSSIDATAEADAGSGGASTGTIPGAGGTSTAYSSITGAGNVSSSAYGNDGGRGESGPTPGDGGNSTATALATSTGTASGFSAVIAHAAVGGELGGGIPSTSTGNGANGGSGVGIATANGVGPDLVFAFSDVDGGQGGTSYGSGFHSGNGGNATSTATAVSTMGLATAQADGEGGLPGLIGPGAVLGTWGSGNTLASATANGVGAATGLANGMGSSGFITAIGKINVPANSYFVQATSVAPSDYAITTDTFTAAIALNAQSLSGAGDTTQYQAASVIVGAPLTGDLTTALTGQPNVLAAIHGNQSNAFAIGHVDERYLVGGQGGAHTYSSDQEINISPVVFSRTDDLIFGMVGAQSIVGGLGAGDSLRFRIERDGTTLVDRTFTDNTTLQNYFTNAALDLGPEVDASVPGNRDLQFLFDLTGSHSGQGIAAQFVVGLGSGGQAAFSASTGSWANPANWANSLHPDGPGATALFAPVGGTPQTITLDEPAVVGNLTITQAAGYTIAPGSGGTLTLNNEASPAVLTDTVGNQIISAPIIVAAAGVNVSIPKGKTVTFSGGVSGAGGVNTISAGILNLSAADSYTGGTMVSSGIVNVAANGALSTGPVAIGSSGRLNLKLGTGAAQMSALSIAGNGTMDITDNIAVVNYGVGNSSPVGTISGYLLTGYSGGAWNGIGIDSSKVASVNAAHSNSHLYAIGYADASDSAVAADHFTPGTVVIEPALVGDANLDGKVNFTDFLLLSSHFNAPNTSWDQGNFNYGTTTNFGDFLLLSANFNNSTPLDNAELYEMNNFANSFGDSLVPSGNGMGFTVVPEPASLGMIGIVAAPLLARRRRRRA